MERDSGGNNVSVPRRDPVQYHSIADGNHDVKSFKRLKTA